MRVGRYDTARYQRVPVLASHVMLIPHVTYEEIATECAIHLHLVTAGFRNKMSYVAKDKEVEAPAAAVKLHKIRITLTSRNVKSLEKSA